jgi:hypothetical protein
MGLDIFISDFIVLNIFISDLIVLDILISDFTVSDILPWQQPTNQPTTAGLDHFFLRPRKKLEQKMDAENVFGNPEGLSFGI